MIILQPIATAQSITVFIRQEGGTYSAVLQDEETLDKYTYSITGTYEDGKLTFELTHDFKDKRFYWLKIEDENGLNLNKSKIFITDQADLEKYDMNEDYYTEIKKDERTYIVK